MLYCALAWVAQRWEARIHWRPIHSYFLLLMLTLTHGLRYSLFHLSVWAGFGLIAWCLLLRVSVLRQERGPGRRVSPFVIQPWKSCELIYAVFSLLKQLGIFMKFQGRGGKETDSYWGKVDRVQSSGSSLQWPFWKIQLAVDWKYSCQGPLWILPLSFSDSCKLADTIVTASLW